MRHSTAVREWQFEDLCSPFRMATSSNPGKKHGITGAGAVTKKYISIPTFWPVSPPPLKGAGQGGVVSLTFFLMVTK